MCGGVQGGPQLIECGKHSDRRCSWRVAPVVFVGKSVITQEEFFPPEKNFAKLTLSVLRVVC